MDTIQSYKCPCCGAPLAFHAESQKLHCESCGTDFELDTMKMLDEADENAMTSSQYDWEHYEPRDFSSDETTSFSLYSCPSCGAQITGEKEDTVGAAICPYCGNATIVKGRFEGTLRPDYLIPFKVDKKAAMEAFEQSFKRAPFLPSEFKDKRKREEMTGVYVPFWMFDCDCHADIRYNAQRTTCWSDHRYEYTKTEFFRLIRAGSIGFANIPVDGSQKMDNAYMEALEPYHYEDAVTFDTAYLSGYLADKYDVTAEDSVERANERVKNSTEAAFAETTEGYTDVVPESSQIRFSNGKIRYALLPVWMLNIQYQGQSYRYAINGQTGKTVGNYPVDKKKKRLYFGTVYTVGVLICAAVSKFLGWL